MAGDQNWTWETCYATVKCWTTWIDVETCVKPLNYVKSFPCLAVHWILKRSQLKHYMQFGTSPSRKIWTSCLIRRKREHFKRTNKYCPWRRVRRSQCSWLVWRREGGGNVWYHYWHLFHAACCKEDTTNQFSKTMLTGKNCELKLKHGKFRKSLNLSQKKNRN